MNIWAIGDLHLSFGVPNKSMDIFGPSWKDHAKKIEESWTSLVATEDLVLIPGDISWAMRLEEAVSILQWIDRLPGTKVLLKGNHDYWWGSLKKIAEILPPSLHLIQNNSFRWKDAVIGGAQAVGYSGVSFQRDSSNIRKIPERKSSIREAAAQEDLSEKIFERELQRLEMSLASLPDEAKFESP